MRRALAIDAQHCLTNRVFLDDERVATVLEVLSREGEARVVGGAVRNALLGLVPGDIDVATSHRPEAVMARAKAAGLRVIPTGVPHGTVTVLSQGLPLEVTTLRQDVETDGRHAVVRFGQDFDEDARRRDFTINALSVDTEGRVHDVTDGVADLAAGRVRFIGDAALRIREDYLRILRFFRFSASYTTGALDHEGVAACVEGASGLSRLSRERVRAELLKLLTAPRAASVVDGMAEVDLLDLIVGVGCRPRRFGRLVAAEEAGAWGPDAMRRLGALALVEPTDAETLRTRLRLSNEERTRLAAMVTALVTLQASGPEAPDDSVIRRLLHSAGRVAALDGVLLGQADSMAAPDDTRWGEAARFAITTEMPVLPITGGDLLGLGLKAGPVVGAVLKDVQARWIRAGFPTEPSTLQTLLREAVDQVDRDER